MREITDEMERTITRVRLLAGLPLRIRVNRGRNKIEQFEGKIESVYPKVFTIRKAGGEISTFSYSDVVARNVKFFKG